MEQLIVGCALYALKYATLNGLAQVSALRILAAERRWVGAARYSN